MTASLTYLGTFDDVVVRYPWPVAVSQAYLKAMIVRHALFGGRLLLNDGYLVSHPLAQAALLERFENPLFGLIDEGFVAILSTEQDILGSIDKRAESGVASFVALKRRTDWPALAQTLGPLSERLRRSGGFVPWPRRDMGSGFAAAMARARGPDPSRPRSRKELGLARTPKPMLRRVFAKFDEEASRSTEALRTKWERIVLDEAERRVWGDKTAIRRELMGLANEAYHFNFGSCLSAEREEIVGVETRHSEAFDELLDVPAIDYELLEGFAPLRAPSHPAMYNGAKLRDFVAPGLASEVRKQAYLKAQSDYLARQIDARHYREASNEYAHYIAKYFGASYKSDKLSFGVSIALFAGTTAAGFALTNPQGAALGAVAFVAEQFVAPHILRKISVAQIERKTRGKPVSPKRWSPRRALASVTIDKAKAQALVAQIPLR